MIFSILLFGEKKKEYFEDAKVLTYKLHSNLHKI